MTSGRLPSLVLIADGFTRSGQDHRIVQAVRFGVRWIILRDRDARPDILELSARLLVGRVRKVAPSTRIALNGPEDLARRLEVGWHRRSDQPLSRAPVRGRSSPEGRSTHTLSEIRQAKEEGVDYILFGHIFDTSSHPGESPRGLSVLAEACQEAGPGMPVIAIGGVTPQRVSGCLDAGAGGVAVLSGLMQAPNLFQAVDAYMQALTPPLESE